MNENTLTIVYGFDKENQIPQFEISLKSVLISKNTNYNILVFLSNDTLKEKTEQIFEKLKVSEIAVAIVVDDLKVYSRDGMYYWLLSPFYTDSDYILQLDNDVIVSTNFNDLINSVRTKKRLGIFGVRINLSLENWSLKTLEKEFNINDKKTLKKWINTGVVLIERKKFIHHYKSKENLINLINKYSFIHNNYGSGEKIQTSDEAFLIYSARNLLGSLKRKYNLRFHSPSTTASNISKKDYFFHYNLKFGENWQRNEKLDFKLLLSDREYEHYVIEKLSTSLCNVSSFDDVPGKEREYIKFVIKELIKNHKELL